MWPWGVILWLLLFLTSTPQTLQVTVWRSCVIGRDGESSDTPCSLPVYLGQKIFIDCGVGARNLQPRDLLKNLVFCRTPLTGPLMSCGSMKSIPPSLGTGIADQEGQIRIASKGIREPQFKFSENFFGRCELKNGSIMYFHFTLQPFRLLHPTTSECHFDPEIVTSPNDPCVTMSFAGEDSIVTCMPRASFIPPDANMEKGSVCATRLEGFKKCPAQSHLSWNALLPHVQNKTTQNGWIVRQPRAMVGDKKAYMACKDPLDLYGTYFIRQYFMQGERPKSTAFVLPPSSADGSRTYVCNYGFCAFSLIVGDTFIVNCTQRRLYVPPTLTSSRYPEFCSEKVTNAMNPCPHHYIRPWSSLGVPIIDRFGLIAGVTITADKIRPPARAFGGCAQAGSLVAPTYFSITVSNGQRTTSTSTVSSRKAKVEAVTSNEPTLSYSIFLLFVTILSSGFNASLVTLSI